MKSPALPLFAALIGLITLPAAAQEDTAHHRAVYQEINDNLARYRKVTGTHTDEPLIFALTGWLDNGKVRKIAARAGEDGEGFEEYYLENEKPLFVYSTYQEASSKKLENRLYFKEGKIFKWLTNGTASGKGAAADFADETERLTSNATAFVAALKKEKGAAAQKSK